MNKWFLVALLTAATLLVVLGVMFTRPYTLRGSVIENPSPAPDIVLASGSGQEFRLSEQRGRITLIFFGFTHCPDVCPATLGEMKQLIERLGEKAGEINFVFITVDPQRDTPDVVGRYTALFSPDIIGLTGSEGQLQTVWDAYGVYREIQDTGSEGNYQVAHSARTYLVDKHGNLRLTYAFGTPVADMEQDLRHLLKEKE